MLRRAWWRRLLSFPIAVLWMAGFVFSLMRIVAVRAGTMPSSASSPLATLAQVLAPGLGAFACFWALRSGGKIWDFRARAAWACLGVSALMLALGSALDGFRQAGTVTLSGADFAFLLQQPLLWLGFFLLTWRGRSLGMLRLIAETLVVVLAAVVLLWSLFLERRLAGSNDSALQKTIAFYFPIFGIAHLFCVSMLLANVRGRPALLRVASWLFAGIACLVGRNFVSFFWVPGQRTPPPLWLDLGSIWGYLLVGMAALIYGAAGASSREKMVDEGQNEDASSPGNAFFNPVLPESERQQRLLRWHRAMMLWLPYFATIGVAGVLISQERHKANSEAVQRILPILSLLLGIVALQMITLWDNLRLAAKLRASNSTLERSVGDRTRHLATLHGITSTLNTSLDRRTVLRVTVEKTIAAVGANGGGIWLRDARRDVYTESAPGDEWTLVHWQGFDDDAATISLLRDLSIADAERQTGPSNFHLSPATRDAVQSGIAPPERRLICVPVRWQGTLMGVMGLMRHEGSFSYEDRALVESVALEAGTALQNARLYSEAAHRADRDSVTELFNHRAIQEQLVTTLARCKRTGNQFSIVMMDLNNFKFFNDTYGHPVGDDVLRAVARGLKESCRASDVLGRYGGDEFIIVLPDTDAPGTIDVCQRVKAELDARHFEPVPGTRLPIAISFGWAAYPGDGDSIHELLTQADANLYSHKRGGASYLSQSAKAARETREELKRLKNRAFGGSFGVLDALVTAIDNKDHYTRHHSEEVTYLSLLVAKEIGYDAEALRAVRISGLLHDVGKIAVPDDILRHPGKLGREEWEIMQQHPVFGALIVKDVPNLQHVLEGIRHHHEKWDGSGYPDKLKGEEIPEMGRLLMMADCYSALTTDRPYRKGWRPQDALEEIERCIGTQFDPRLCEVFLRVMRQELMLESGNAEPGSTDYGTRIAENFGDEATAVPDQTNPKDFVERRKI
ncbi:diguanylate cyclase (GGDEF) domain-containing protein/HDIG domain-containing protein [Abditibacterium utsteinense]|uniref:Diguanylate cyclase (GGDEF) domain-containing protein/HDIG domain-containing protein n=1 Tax=Abditibacterium utsteinense TaxID=1960156 RepID=A0A2S8SPX7_9BACT|nr:diguanylate cyclase [Abditibacterium utsteinense]PQV62848.1 diguanylate cyclase (GGDEF) domain-containing protein/HDIG domain-containing protein [Abditibacterium utsteinense]